MSLWRERLRRSTGFIFKVRRWTYNMYPLPAIRDEVQKGVDLLLPVEEDKICSACKLDREKHGKSPRALHTLPGEVLRGVKDGKATFKNRKLPIYICGHCDGDVLEKALQASQKRTSKK